MQSARVPAVRLNVLEVLFCQACQPAVFARFIVAAWVMPAALHDWPAVGTALPVYTASVEPPLWLTALFVVTLYEAVVGTLMSHATESLALIQTKSWVEQEIGR